MTKVENIVPRQTKEMTVAKWRMHEKREHFFNFLKNVKITSFSNKLMSSYVLLIYQPDFEHIML